MHKNWLHLDGAPTDGNGFLATLPPELQKEPSLATFKDAGTLAKSYVEGQKLIGSKRIALPGEKANPAEWDSFFNQIGRPETHDKYDDVVLKNEKGEVLITPKPEESEVLKKLFHKMGLTKAQARQMQEFSLDYVHKGLTAKEAAAQQEADANVNALKQEWGDKFDVNVDVARSVIKKFGGEQAADIQQFLNESGIGNNPKLIKLFANIGSSILEDTGNRGSGNNQLPLNDQTRASTEIANLMVDAEFQKALGDAQHPGHQAAVNRWTNLFAAAHPGKSE